MAIHGAGLTDDLPGHVHTALRGTALNEPAPPGGTHREMLVYPKEVIDAIEKAAVRTNMQDQYADEIAKMRSNRALSDERKKHASS
jgi:MOSC domain-containing protein YiiM